MLGADFFDFWSIGRLILAGQNPYSYPMAPYPPATSYFFALLAFLPFQLSFGLWTGLNIVLVVDYIRKLKQNRWKWAWLGFTPVIFILMTGQIDIVFLWLASMMPSKGLKAVLLGALLTLKPQIAFIVLPWYLLQWVLHERKTLVQWLLGTAALQAFPLLLDPSLFQKWLAAAQSVQERRMLASPGVFALSNLGVPLIIMILMALAICILGLRRDSMTSRAAQLLAIPMGLWYENVLLLGSVPWWLVVPVSWLAFYVGTLVHSNYPFVIIPLLIFGWRILSESELAKIPQPA
jgi:hypothetical protein